VYQYHKSLIHDCDTFTGIQNSLLTRFAISDCDCDCESSDELRISWILAMLPTDISWSWRRFLWLQHNTINWCSNQCCWQECTSTTWVTLTLNWKCWQIAVESSKFSLNSTQLYHRLYQLKDCSKTDGQISHATTVWVTDSMFEKLATKANHGLF